MNKQIKTAEGVVELDKQLVKLFEANSYSIEFVKSKSGSKDNKSEDSHYCLNTLDIEENELGAEDILSDSEVLALYLQQNGYGNIEKFAEKLKAALNKAYANATTPFQAGKNAGLDNALILIDDLVKKVCNNEKK